MIQPPLVAACRRQPVDRVPIWLMRQAGRYLPEYRALRARHGMLEIIGEPDLAATITLQPLQRFDLDAAIIFADILPPLVGMGLELSFGPGTGPVIHNPIRSSADVEGLRVTEPREDLGSTLRALELVRRDLSPTVALVGFSGAPFTLATYAIEGGTSRQFTNTKRMMFEQSALWHSLMSKLTRMVIDYLSAQAESGAQVLQIFDSWAGVLAAHDYREYVLPYVQEICVEVQETGAPVIYFSTGTGGMLDVLGELRCQVLSLDWRVNLAWARQVLPGNLALQGNLEPALLFGGLEVLEQRASHILYDVAAEPGFIFNLGHGVLPETPLESVARLVEVVHGYSLPVTGNSLETAGE